MGETKREAAATAVLMTSEQHAQRELARELEERKASGTQLDKTVPGGHYLHSDGRPHDAENRPIKSGAKQLSAEDAEARLRELAEEKAELETAVARHRATAAAGGGTSKPSEEELEGMTLAELKAEAERRGVAIEEGSGADGRVVKADYVQALK